MTDARDVVAESIPCNIVYGRSNAADKILKALKAAGYSIVRTNEVRDAALEEAAAICDEAHSDAQEFGAPIWGNHLATDIRSLKSPARQSEDGR